MTITTTPPPTTTSTTTSTSPPFATITQQPNIFSPSGLQRINSSSLSDSWNGYGVSPSGSGITNFYSTGSYIHYQLPSGTNAQAIQINPNSLLRQADSMFELYDDQMRLNGPITVTTTTTTTRSPSTTPTPVDLSYIKKI